MASDDEPPQPLWLVAFAILRDTLVISYRGILSYLQWAVSVDVWWGKAILLGWPLLALLTAFLSVSGLVKA